MFANERQNKICDILKEGGAVTTSELVKEFGVSAETVRRDLLELESSGKLQRVHGGAVKISKMREFHNRSKRNNENSGEKRALGKAAAEFVSPGDTIAVDIGSTAVGFAESIKPIPNLTVVTHSGDVFEILKNNHNTKVILIGGEFSAEENSFYGPLTLQTYQKLHVNKSFILPSAVSLNFGICDFLSEYYILQKTLIKICDRTFILADSSKYEKKALYKLDDMKAEYTYITDSALPENLKKLYSENGLNVITSKDDIKK